MRILLLLPFLGLSVCSIDASPVEVNERIIGGWDCKPHEAQYQVFVSNGSVRCGGSLLSSKWVLTAAHCDSPGLQAYIGIQDLYDIKNRKVQPVKVQRKINPGYNKAKQFNDIMLIELKDNVPSPKTVNLPAECSNYPDKAPENTKLLVAGWGSLGGGKNAVLPSKLRCLNIEKERCARAMPPITADAFCAGKGNHKTRVGDSGGGLVLEATNEVYGVVQRGWLPDHMYPGIFTSVCSHLAWIKQVTGL